MSANKFLYPLFDHWFRGGNIWLYSDPHFSDDEMKYIRKDYIGDEEQVKRINSKVGKNDTIIILGDIGNTDWVKKIRGYKVLIMGNHDSGKSNYQRIIKDYETFDSSEIGTEDIKTKEIWTKMHGRMEVLDMEYYKKYFHQHHEDNHLFDEVYEGPLMINEKFMLSHEPLRLPDNCIFNIHGHDHSNWFQQPNHLNVCAEWINYTPVSLLEMFKKGAFKGVDDIHRITIDKATKKAKEKENE